MYNSDSWVHKATHGYRDAQQSFNDDDERKPWHDANDDVWKRNDEYDDGGHINEKHDDERYFGIKSHDGNDGGQPLDEKQGIIFKLKI